MVWGWSHCRPTTPANSTCEQSVIVAMVTHFHIPTCQCYWVRLVGFFLSLVVGCLSTLLILLDSFSGLLNSCRQLSTMERRFFPFCFSPSPSPSPTLPLCPSFHCLWSSRVLHHDDVILFLPITSWWHNVVCTHTSGAHYWSHPAASVYENLQLELCQDCQQVSRVWWYKRTEEVGHGQPSYNSDHHHRRLQARAYLGIARVILNHAYSYHEDRTRRHMVTSI